MQWLAAAYPTPTSTVVTDTLYLPVRQQLHHETQLSCTTREFLTDQVQLLFQDLGCNTLQCDCNKEPKEACVTPMQCNNVELCSTGWHCSQSLSSTLHALHSTV